MKAGLSTNVIRKMRILVRILSVTGLLVFYLAANTHFTFLHQVIHPDEITLSHTELDEDDPCHRSIYHGDDLGCNHQFHIEKVSGCSLFHTAAHHDEIVIPPLHSDLVFFRCSFIAGSEMHAFGSVHFLLSTRGPPAVLPA
jgi:hypothetical protein